MRFAEDAGDFRSERITGKRLYQGRLVKLAGHFAGEPVTAIPAEQAVAHLAPRHEIERFGVRPEPENFGDVDVAGNLIEIRDAIGPMRAPVPAMHAFQFGI